MRYTTMNDSVLINTVRQYEEGCITATELLHRFIFELQGEASEFFASIEGTSIVGTKG